MEIFLFLRPAQLFSVIRVDGILPVFPDDISRV